MMVTTMGEDYVTFAEAKGLRSSTIFLRYCLRNAILPQTTALALALGQILSGAVLVEVIFGYPGIGTLLFQAIRENDHFLIQGIVFTVIVALGLATLLLDVVYPWLDPRISYRRQRRETGTDAPLPRAAIQLAALVGIVLAVCPARRCSSSSATSPSTPNSRGRCRCAPCSRPRGSIRSAPTGRAAICSPPWSPARRSPSSIGFIAGFLGVGIGTALAFIAGYYRGMTDTVIRGIADIGLTVPGLLVLIIIAVSVRGGPDGQPDGDRRRLAGVAEPDAHHPRPGADPARARLRRGGPPQRHERAGDHLARDDAEPAALSGGHAGQRGVRRDPRLDRPGGARPRPARIADARHDALLGQLQRRHSSTAGGGGGSRRSSSS